MIRPFQFGPWEHRISSARASNGKFALVQQLTGEIHLYTVEGRLVRVLPRAIRSDTQAVFSWTDQDHLFTVSGNEVWLHNLLTDETSLVREFHQYSQLSAAHAEGDLTPDGWLALCGIAPEDGTEYGFCYNVHTRQSSDVRQLTGPIDGLKAAHGGWLVVSAESGIRAFPQSGPFNWLASENGHACTAVYQGRSKFLWFSNKRRDPWQNGIELIDIENPGDRRVLMDLGRQNYAGHVSASDTDAYISVYDPTTVLPNQIWRAGFDGSTPELLFEWHSPYNGEATPRASYSKGLVMFNRWDGTEQTAWGLQVANNTATNVVVPPPVEAPKDYELVSMVNEPDADYMMVLPIRDGKALPWKMFKKTL